jgi:hypothetical protein
VRKEEEPRVEEGVQGVPQEALAFWQETFAVHCQGPLRSQDRLDGSDGDCVEEGQGQMSYKECMGVAKKMYAKYRKTHTKSDGSVSLNMADLKALF